MSSVGYPQAPEVTKMASTSQIEEVAKEKKISVHAISVLKKVIENCKNESVTKKLHIPLNIDYEERVSYYTGFPKSFIKQFIDFSNSENSDSASFSRIDVLESMTQINLDLQNHIYQKLYKRIRVSQPMNFQCFCSELIAMGFDTQKTSTGLILMENPVITFERYNYVSKIMKCRELNKHIYYIDERIVDLNIFNNRLSKGKTFRKPDVEYIGFEKMIFYHIVSKDGCGDSLFCYQVDREDFKQWLWHIVLPSLKPSSVVVLNNGPLRVTSTYKKITKFESKSEMIKCLKENNIPCNSMMRKAELYTLIQKCSIQKDLENVDDILKSQGHEVIRFPSNLTELSFNDLIWEDIKTNLIKHRVDITDRASLKMSITKLLECMNSDTWASFENIIIGLEKKVFKIDAELEEIIEKYKLEPYVYPTL